MDEKYLRVLAALDKSCNLRLKFANGFLEVVEVDLICLNVPEFDPNFSDKGGVDLHVQVDHQGIQVVVLQISIMVRVAVVHCFCQL